MFGVAKLTSPKSSRSKLTLTPDKDEYISTLTEFEAGGLSKYAVIESSLVASHATL